MATGMSYAQAELRVALRRRRTFAMNMVVPAALVGTLVWAGAPSVHAAVVITVLFAFFGTFGSAIPLVRDLETGRLTRLIHAGASPVSLLAQRVAVSVAIDCAQLIPSVAIVLLAKNGIALPSVTLGVIAALLVANMVGVWLALLTRSIGEAALVSSISALLLLHMSGVFRTPVPDTLGETLASVSPFAYLHQALRAGFGLSAPPSAAQLTTALLVAFFALATLLLVPRKTRVFALQTRR